MSATAPFAQMNQSIAALPESDVLPVDVWNPSFCGDINIHIRRNGCWFYEDSAMTRHAMVKLFSRVLWREGDRYFLKTPVEKVGITVDDVPFYVNQLDVISHADTSYLQFTTATEDVVVAGPQHPLRIVQDAETGEPSPYIMIRFGMEARLSRNVFYQLVTLAEEEPYQDRLAYVVKSGESHFVLGFNE